MFSFGKRTAAIALSAAVALGTLGLGVAQADDSLEQLKDRGFVYVGFANEKPYAYATPEGTLTGENPEVARAVLKQIGIDQMNGVLTQFGALIPGLKAHRFDMITASMAILPVRCEQVDFANPEVSYGESLAVEAGNPYDLHSYQDIAAQSSTSVAVMTGASEYDFMTSLGVNPSQIKVVPDQAAAIAALRSGRVDAITMTGLSLQTKLDALGNPADIERVQDFEQPVIDGKSVVSYGAAAFRQEDDALREAYNKGLAKLKESGKLLEIIRPFGFTESNIPPDGVTAESLCNG